MRDLTHVKRVRCEINYQNSACGFNCALRALLLLHSLNATPPCPDGDSSVVARVLLKPFADSSGYVYLLHSLPMA